MTGRFRLLALDIDGTLLRSDKQISPRTLLALRAAQAAGVRIVLVTGRRHPAARRVAAQLGFSVPLILHNGALVVDGGDVLRCVTLPRPIAVQAIRIGEAARADPVVHWGTGGEGRLLVGNVSRSNTLLANYLDRSRPDVATVADLEAALPENPVQVMFGGPSDGMDALHQELARGLGERARVERTVYPQEGVGLLDVLHPAVGKAPALSFLRARFGLEAVETLAIGDNWNDQEMLEQAGLGLVMGNADPGLRLLGLPVIGSNDEDGVAVAVERHILSGG